MTLTERDDLCIHFAHAVTRTRYENLSPAAIEAAKKSLLDTLGVILAASTLEPAVQPVLEHVRESVGAPESTLLGIGGRAPASLAALANGALAHWRTARGIKVSSFTPEALQDESVRALARRVFPVEESDGSRQPSAAVPRVRVITCDGRTFERVGDKVPGSAQAPMTWPELSRKFVDCAAVAARSVPESKSLEVVDLIAHLEDVADVAQLVRRLG